MKHQKVIDILRKKGVRLTPQRLLILSVVADSDAPVPVDEIHRRVCESYPYIDVATVYRTLHLFKSLGVVTEVGAGDRLRFELSIPGARHHHMVCRVCGKAYDLSPTYLEELRRRLVEEFGFRPDLDHFTLAGVCARCAEGQGTEG